MVSECCSIKLIPYILFEKYINILALEMASPGKRVMSYQHKSIYLFLIFYKIVNEVHDRQTYRSTMKTVKASTKHRH